MLVYNIYDKAFKPQEQKFAGAGGRSHMYYKNKLFVLWQL